MELPPDAALRGISPEIPPPEEASQSAVMNGPPLQLPKEPQEPSERTSLSDIADRAPRGSALEAVKNLPANPAAAASRGTAAVCSRNLFFLTKF
ncbi:MAG: hypothetical protein LLG04_07405 [Parachlamydia sp.]|nr:hypothetical protein [Parachlamydia sp.]